MMDHIKYVTKRLEQLSWAALNHGQCSHTIEYTILFLYKNTPSNPLEAERGGGTTRPRIEHKMGSTKYRPLDLQQLSLCKGN